MGDLGRDKRLAELADELRRMVIETLCHAQAGHPGGSLSAAEILAALIFSVMRIDPRHPDWEARDRFILSKGHACLLYTSDAADDLTRLDLGGRRIVKEK